MAYSPAPVEQLIEVMPHPAGKSDVLINANPLWTPPEGVRAIFGGFLIAQSVAAAHATAPRGFAVNSLQAVFLRPGTSVQPIEYHVERAANGRTFATRIVRAIQEDVQLFIATISLQKMPTQTQQDEISIHQYSEPMPEVGDATPEHTPPDQTNAMVQMGYYTPEKADHDHGPQDPFTWRHLPHFPVEPSNPATVRLRSFVRSPPLQSDSPAVHLAALSFLTDEWLIGMPSLANPTVAGRNARNTRVQATISHSLFLHDAGARADEWMVSERISTWADCSRVLVQQKLWNYRTGKLVVSCLQEGLVRLVATRL